MRQFTVATTKKTGSERSAMIDGINDELILAARLLLATLFRIFGAIYRLVSNPLAIVDGLPGW
jgi:hypothetical protein